MRSAVWRGVELLSASASTSGSSQGQGQTIENFGKSASKNVEAIGGVPKNVTQLQPIIDELMRKVIVIAI
jgi:hypothetical protein